MSLMNIMDIASTGMSAQLIRLNTTASNLANAGSVGESEETTYKSKQPLFAPVLNDVVSNDFNGQGVQVTEISQLNTPLKKRHQPGHPLADKDGFVYLTNVNSMEEMANMIAASRSYQNNIQVANTAKQMMLRTLQLGS